MLGFEPGMFSVASGLLGPSMLPLLQAYLGGLKVQMQSSSVPQRMVGESGWRRVPSLAGATDGV